MKHKIGISLLVFILAIVFAVNVNAQTTIKEDATKYEGDVYIIGSSKFDNNVIVTGTMIGVAGARESIIQYDIYQNWDFDPEDLKIYYYSELSKGWSILPTTSEEEFKDLTESETKELTENLNIYYVNQKEKIIEVPYDVDIKDGYELAFNIYVSGNEKEIEYENGKLLVPAAVSLFETYLTNENGEYILLDEFEQVDTVFKNDSVVVKTLAELKQAIAEEKTQIRLGADIVDITETITIPYPVQFKGAGYKLAFKDIQKTDTSESASGLVISGDHSRITDLVIEMDAKEGWQGNYGLQIYNALGVSITNYTGTKSDAALLVNGAVIYLDGEIDVTGNEFGGIEVSKGKNPDLENGILYVYGNITMKDEAIDKPVIWVEKNQGKVYDYTQSFVTNEDIPNAVGETQIYYYSSEDVYKNVEVSTPNDLILAMQLTDVENITLSDNIDLPTTVVVNKKITLDLNGKTLTAKNDTVGDGIFKVITGGDLTIDGEGTIDSACQTNDYSMALWVTETGKATINGGTFTNKGAKALEDDGDPNNNELIYASVEGQITINGGKFIGNTENTTHGVKYTLNLKDTSKATITVKGGTFTGYNPANSASENPRMNFLADGYKVVLDNNEYTVVKVEETDVILADGMACADLQTAVNTASKVKLLNSIDLPKAVVVSTKVTLDLNGKTLTAKTDTVGDGIFTVITGGDLTINGEGTIDSACQTNDYSMAIWAKETGKVTINGGTFTNKGAKALEDDGDPNNNELIYARDSAQITINGGKFIGNTENETYGARYTLNLRDQDNEKASIVVKGGAFTGYDPANSKSENPTKNLVAEGYKVTVSGDVYTVVAE